MAEPPTSSIAALIETQAIRSPRAVAVRSREADLTYGELNEKAERLASLLRAEGVGPEVPVGLCVERSPELVVSIFAISKAGGAYLPLDPAYPRERRIWMARDAGLSLILTQEHLRPDLEDVTSGDGGVRLLLLEGREQAGRRGPEEGHRPLTGGREPGSESEAGGLAYVIYTSGSTGRPKGVMVPNRGLRNLVEAQRETFGVGPEDRILQFSSLSFDASIFEMLMALASGATLHLCPSGSPPAGDALADLLREERITNVTLSPSVLATLPPARLPDLRTLICAGEALPEGLVERWAPGRKMFNAYGPTETTVWATVARCREGGGAPPIGPPISGARTHLLDDKLRSVPRGEPGELFVEGPGVARGYLGRPALTAERFLPCPFTSQPGERMYRTGDLGRRREAGAIEFLGRVDHQVKIRGNRVELGEIEATLTAHPGISAAAVAATPAGTGEIRLAAYFVPEPPAAQKTSAEAAALSADPSADLTAEQLRDFLKRSLPSFMIPSHFTPLPALPLTPSGKVDRRALPDPRAEVGAASPGSAPATPTEEALAAIYAEVFDLPAVDPEAAFLDLGGHSLTVVQILARAHRTLGIDLKPRELYEHSSWRSLAARVDHLRAASEEAALDGLGDLGKAPRDEALPLSFSQRRVWFIQRLDPGNRAYSAQASLRLRGDLDVALVRRAFAEIVRRHEIYRTTFPEIDGRPSAVVHGEAQAAAVFEVPLVELPPVPTDEIEREIEALRRGEFERGFDLGSLPLIRWRLLHLAPDDHLLVHTEHHIVHDGWSFNVLLAEFLELYRAYAAGRPASLPELPLDFVDFAHWQHQRAESGDFEPQLAYWRERLAGRPPLLELPLDRPRPRIPGFRGEAPRIQLPAELGARLEAFSRRRGVTLFTTMLAALAAMLERYTGQDDVLIGTGAAHRRWPETENLIGMLINNLVLRADLSGDPTFADLLDRVHDSALGAYAHQDVPFDLVVDAVRPQRELSYNPLFQVMFSFHDSPLPELSLPGLSLELEEGVAGGGAKFDLNIIAIPDAGRRRAGDSEAPKGATKGAGTGIDLLWEYNSDLFDAATIDRMVAHYLTLLDAAVREPETRVADLPMLSREEERRLIADWGARRGDFRRPGSLHGRFEEYAAQRPHAVALTAGDGTGTELTYGELDRRANRLARRLQNLGAGPETVVGLCLGRSLDLVTAILAILKSGGAYLPLDPAHPPERIAFVLEDAGAPILVAAEGLVDRLPAGEHHLILLDSEEESRTLANLSTARLTSAGEDAADHLAYVIYTSGSTGRPKGVLVTHRNALRLLDATESWFAFGPEDVWTLFHSYAFDFSVWELWGALAYGGRLVMVPNGVSRSPGDFLALLRREEVTILNQTPSAFRQLMEAEAAEGPGAPGKLALRRVIFGGEALDPPSLAPWFERHGDTEPLLVNMYGITETTVHVTYRALSKDDLDPTRGSCIGRPIPDLELYVLDPELRPVPIGVPGELYVGGDGLARGYLGRPALTAQRFVPHPFADPSAGEPGARLYRTGDRARTRPDGDVEYLGRTDHQIKIRGFRIEPGEIETALAAHPAVRRAVVLVRDEGGEPMLVAYLISEIGPGQGTAGPSVEELRRWLASSIPEYMIPAAFVTLDELPLTANGKLDRQALPAPDRDRPELESDFAAPRTREEEILAGIWSEVLGVERVGIRDNYFALGGDSIRAIQVLSRARERGLELALPELFRHQTVETLAPVAGVGEGAVAAREPFQLARDLAGFDRAALPADVEDAYPLTQLQTGMVYHGESDPGSALYHDILSLDLEGPFDPAALERAAATLAARHEILRTSFDLASFDEPLQLVHREAMPAITSEDLAGADPDDQEERLAAWMDEEKAQPLDGSRAPLLRIFLFRRGTGRIELALSLHHAILDGWSLASATTELLQLYAAEAAGRSPELPPLPATRFADFVALERTALASEEDAEFWRREISAIPETRLQRWPLDDARKATANSLEIDLPAEVSAALRDLAAREEIPLRTLLLAAHLRVIAGLTGQRGVVTGLTTHGRPETADGDRTLGLFLNTLPLAARLGAESWVELARSTFETECRLLPHRRFPLAQIQRLAGGRPLFETSFNYTEFHVYGRLSELDGLTVRGKRGFEATNFALLANFQSDPATGGLSIRLTYDPESLPRRQMESAGGAYRRALAAMAADPGAPCRQGSLLSESELNRIVVSFNDTHRPYPAAGNAVEIFESQVAQRGEAVALVFEGEHLTYAGLDRRANRLAHHLRTLGVGPETPVGLCLERGLDMIVGLVAILKAGGAYVAMEPSYPQRRLELMIEDTAMAVILTHRRHLGGLPESGFEAVCLDDLPASWESLPGRPPERDGRYRLGPDNLIYISYTSGSTGRPKGVEVHHRGVLRLVLGCEYVRLGPEETVFLFSPLLFDVSTFEIFGALLHGGRLVVAAPGTPALEDLAEVIESEGVTTLWLTTGIFHQITEGYLDRFKGVRQFLAGGDIVSPAAVNRVLEQLPECRFVDGYGPTEATTFAAAHPVSEPIPVGRSVPIGRPIENTTLYVVDDLLEPLPIGTPGELLIGGPGVARGYHNHPALTAERFVPDPFGEPGSRLYRTGDLARHLDDGTLDFLGRLDHQVKIRGFRVEPGEIDAVLAHHPRVAEALVVPKLDPGGGNRLVAYVVAAEGTGGDLAAELRSYLEERLPDYLIPSAFVSLDAIPLTPIGKPDRAALPDPAPARAEAGTDYRAPRNPAEELLAEIWAGVLGIERVGIDDDFFELGGHSLLATRLIAQVRRAFGTALPLAHLLSAPTIAGLAAAVAAGRGEAAAIDGVLPPLIPSPADADRPFPLTEIQQAYWVGRSGDFDLGNVAPHLYVELESGELDLPRFEAAWRRTVERHGMLRAVVGRDGQQRILAEVPAYDIESLDLSALPSDEAEAALAKARHRMSHQLFDTDRWPLFEIRASLLPGKRTRLHLSLDVLIVDGWSLNLLFAELRDSYDDPDSEPAPLSISFRDYVVHEQALHHSDPYRLSKAYWHARLDTLPPAPELPLAVNPATLEHPRFVRRSGRLEAGAWKRLKVAARRAGLSPSGVLLAAWSEVLAAWSKSPRFTVNLTLFHRLPVHPEVDRLLGDFTSLTLLEIDTSGGGSFEERARRQRDRLWNDLDHRYFGGVRMLRELARRRRGLPAAAMPVVFTSTLALASGEEEHPADRFGRRVFTITQTPQVWLDHQVLERGGELIFNWDAVEEIFPEGLLDDMFGAYRGLLDQLIDEPASWREPWSSQTSSLVPTRRIELRARINSRSRSPAGDTLDSLFTRRAAESPDRPAVISSERALSYGEISDLAERLAGELLRRGARPGKLVAVVLEKGWRQAVATLGILRAGAAYLPLDPELPGERLSYLLEHGEVELAVTRDALGASLDWPAKVDRLPLEILDALPAAATASPSAATPEALAYVIYTSGSTGLPKGVMIDHRGAVNTVLDVNRRFAVGPDDRVLALSSLSFDLSVYDLFGTFAAGATAVMPDGESRRDPAHWSDIARRHGVTVWDSVPALMGLLADYAEQHPGAFPPSLRLTLLSGDWLPVELPERLERLSPGIEVISLGGATEASIWSIFHRASACDAGARIPGCGSVPYGKPLANQSIHVLDGDLAPRPVWVPGELYIGGDGIALGYWRDEERTERGFVTHPATGERLYRTGDLGRNLPDGSIEFLGREDHQVKIQGYRVELGEIEAHLASHPAVRVAVAVATDRPGGKRLVAYVVAGDGAPPAGDLVPQVRDHLRSKLPDYMVPGRIIVLDALPLTANGKIDRRALPAPDAPEERKHRDEPNAAVPTGVPARAPADRLDEAVARLVAGVLTLDDLDPETDLLEAGADSVDMVRIANRLETELGRRPELNRFYQRPTVAALVEMMREAVGEPAPAAESATGQATAGFELILDPQERDRFKYRRPGLREVDGHRTIELPGEARLEDHLARRTYRRFLPETIPFERFARWLGAIRAIPTGGELKFLYPSAGGLYPVQVCLHIQNGRVESVPDGTYYYHPVGHRLVEISPGAAVDPEVHHRLINRPVFDSAAFSVFLIARMAAIEPLYGEISHSFATLEAGYLAQLLVEKGKEVDLGFCPIGSLDFDRLRPLFDLETADRLVHSLVGGAIDPSEPWSGLETGVGPPPGDGAPRVAAGGSERGVEGRFEEGEI